MPSPLSELNCLLSFPAFLQCYGLDPLPRWRSHLSTFVASKTQAPCSLLTAFWQPSFPPHVSPGSSPIGDPAAQTLMLTLFDSVSFQPLTFKVRPGNSWWLKCTSSNALLTLHRGYQPWGEGGLRGQQCHQQQDGRALVVPVLNNTYALTHREDGVAIVQLVRDIFFKYTEFW